MGAMTTTAWVAAGLACCVVALLVASAAVRRRAAVEHTRRVRLEQELAQARTDVAALGRRLDDLGQEVAAARDTAEREFVITSLGDGASALDRAPTPARGTGLEERLVRTLSRSSGSSSGAAATGLLVKAAALGHGVRRALSPEVLDRAVAEAAVARRRSRRDRRRELRDARRFVRSVRVQEQPPGKHVA